MDVAAMNAVIRKKIEAPMASNETIEAHLAHLQTAVDETRKDVRELRVGLGALRDKFDDVRESLSERIEDVSRSLNAKVEDVSRSLNAKVEDVSKSLNAKIDQTNKELAGMRADIAGLCAMQRAMLWIMGGTGSLVGINTLAKAYGWW
jgi:chromosome segregation ATPase